MCQESVTDASRGWIGLWTPRLTLKMSQCSKVGCAVQFVHGSAHTFVPRHSCLGIAENSIGYAHCVHLAKVEGRLFRAAAISTLVLKTTCAIGASVAMGILVDWNTTTYSRKWARFWVVVFTIVNTVLLCIQVCVSATLFRDMPDTHTSCSPCMQAFAARILWIPGQRAAQHRRAISIGITSLHASNPKLAAAANEVIARHYGLDQLSSKTSLI